MPTRIVRIDALRGIAAFAVCLYHYSGGFGPFLAAPAAINLVPAFGFTGVFLFFVISGFCIHMRWTKLKAAGEGNPSINFSSFWKRRWVRLYPAYLASLALYFGWGYLQGKVKFTWFLAYDFLAHLLMLHNLDPRTVYSLNGVLWTLAIEEQLYLLYFALLWMRKRFGWKAALAACLAARFLWFGFTFIVRKKTGFDIPFTEGALSNWWIWALGALAVENYFGLVKLPRWNNSLTLCGISLFVAGSLHYGANAATSLSVVRTAWLLEPLFWGSGFYFLINRIMAQKASSDSRLLHWSAWVGLFSYSLYLTHEFVFAAGREYFGPLILALSLGFAYLFFVIFERPFITINSKENLRANWIKHGSRS